MKKFLKAFLVGVLTVFTALSLLACAPADLEKAEKKMKDEGYKVSIVDDYGLINGCLGIMTITDSEGILDLDAEVATAYFFETKEDAKAYYESSDSGWLKGKWVIKGDEDIYEDFIG